MSARHADRGYAAVARARGVALVTVLLALALLTAMVGRLGFSNQVWVRQTGNGAAFLQSAQATRAVQDWVSLMLLQNDNNYDSFQDDWARPLAPLPIGSGFVRGYMEDMQARLNLNNLLDSNGVTNHEALQRLRRLLRILDLNPGIADAVVDWLDADNSPSGPWGAEDGYYLGLNPPYLAANRRFRDAAELRLVRGVNAAVWQQLKPFVSALPRADVAVNINTASPEVLASAVPHWGSPRSAAVEAAQWVGQARQTPFRTVKEFYDAAGLDYDEDEPPTGLSVRSKFFLAHTRVELGDHARNVATLYQRPGQRDEQHADGRARVLAHWREFE
ncbi:MAG: type II secretion system minor pseudopilin GspK [Gammaproteobacteria bacterium]|nr:type II secretion system minor pseudopilin GspK [Gammaproteobacteria bacterium]